MKIRTGALFVVEFLLVSIVPLPSRQVLAQNPASTELNRAVNKLSMGQIDGVDIDQIARSGAVQAIPALKQQFAKQNYPSAKAKLANALVRLGVKDQVYWDFLQAQAAAALNSDIPFPTRFNSQGKVVPHQFLPEFLEWTKAHQLLPESVAQNVVYEIPGKVLLLAQTGDPRGLSLLRRAMSSRNYMIQAAAAKGLAKLQDVEFVPMIIGACQAAPADMSPAIAEALAFFDDPRARAEAKHYLPKSYVGALRIKEGVGQ